MSETTKPNPGSPEAVQAGCRCPQGDNGHGKGCGMTDDNGQPLFWMNADCPLHGGGCVMPWIIYVVMVLMFTPLVGIMWLLFLDALGIRTFRFGGRL